MKTPPLPTTLTHLRNRTEHSYRTAYGKLERVLDHQQAKAAGIVDRHGTWGHVRWSKACKAKGIKPIFGVELAVVADMEVREKQPANFMSFLARNNSGLKELYELTSLATEKFYYIPRLDYDAVRDALKTGNIVGLSGPAPDASKIVGLKNFFIELNQLSPAFVPDLAKRLKYPLVATGDNLYPLPQDKAAYEIVMGDRRDSRTAAGHIIQAWEWLQQWPDYSMAIRIAEDIAKDCSADLPSAEMVHPPVVKTLEAMCADGAPERHINLKDPIYKARLARELALIHEKKFEDYFYVVADMVNWARERMLVGPARGSSCGSLVCYLIGITGIDPLKYDLLFERFIDINRGGWRYDSSFKGFPEVKFE